VAQDQSHTTSLTFFVEHTENLKLFLEWKTLIWSTENTGPQILNLPLEEGGQGLVDIGCRVMAFGVASIWRLLYGSSDLVWRSTAILLLRQAGMLDYSSGLFLMNAKCIDLSLLPPFYNSVAAVEIGTTPWRSSDQLYR